MKIIEPTENKLHKKLEKIGARFLCFLKAAYKEEGPFFTILDLLLEAFSPQLPQLLSEWIQIFSQKHLGRIATYVKRKAKGLFLRIVTL